MGELVDVVNTFVEGFSSRDPEKVLEQCNDEFTFKLVPEQVAVLGKAQFLEAVEPLTTVTLQAKADH